MESLPLELRNTAALPSGPLPANMEARGRGQAAKQDGQELALIEVYLGL